MSEVTAPPLAGVTPYLSIRGASDAVEFYKRAFGAEELMRMVMPNDTRLMHCHLRINQADVLLADEFAEYGDEELGAPRGVTLHLQVDDADAWFARAAEAGATVTMPLADQFWGDRYGRVRDPFGHTWAIAAPIRK